MWSGFYRIAKVWALDASAKVRYPFTMNARIIPAAKRTESVRYAIRDIIVEAQKLIPKDKKVLPLNIGDPCTFDFITPAHLQEIVRSAFMTNGGYAPSEGSGEAREAVAKFQEKFGLKNVNPADTIITTGGAEAIQLVFQALLNPGDNVLLPCPSYPAYNAAVNFLQGEIREYFLDEERGWQIDPEEIEAKIDEKTKALVVINPNNPTGAILTENTLRAVLEIARKHRLLVIADEQVYPFYTYDDKKIHTCASFDMDVPVISIGSMSKTYLMPGWRLGWMVFFDPQTELASLKETIMKFKRIQLGSPHPLQHAIPAALLGSHDFVDETTEKLLRRRNLLIEGIKKIDGLSLVPPDGAFYAYIRLNLPIRSDKEFVLKLAADTGILCVPGEGLGQKAGTFHMRWVFLPPEPVLSEALTKLETFTAKYRR